MPDLQTGLRVWVRGIVQGVGFRPFVYSLAIRYALTGWVRNTSGGVEIEVNGPASTLAEFVTAIQSERPPLARIDEIETQPSLPDHYSRFEILASQSEAGQFIPISPDVCTCPDCRRELFDPANRRFRYPFINCTNCGPRFTIIQDIPYDRPQTTMAGFKLCPACQAEYDNPLDRRFHAQPTACPVCGPQLSFVVQGETIARSKEDLHREDTKDAKKKKSSGEDALQMARRWLSEGKIVAIKGLGGYLLACDATNPSAVAELRRRKKRSDKAFALMAFDIETIERHCQVSQSERDLLLAHTSPIVLLEKRADSDIAPAVAPGQTSLGFMLPYTPLHWLLLEPEETLPGPPLKGREQEPLPQPLPSREEESRISPFPPMTPPSPRFALPQGSEGKGAGGIGSSVLVMTSGNLSEEPIAYRDEDAFERLDEIADGFLLHDRPIHMRVDDTVLRVIRSRPYLLRRARGYAPDSIALPRAVPPILATGAELKNTFCLTRDRYAFLSHHIGDLENYETLLSFEEGIAHYERLFRIQPERIACDLHPDYLASRYAHQRAAETSLPLIEVQHHHAHLAACLADNGWDTTEPVIGLIYDGTGLGTDRAVWGGEVLLGGYLGYRRYFHLAYAPLPGGDAATHRPSRMALAHLWQAGLDWEPDLPPVIDLCADERTLLRTQMEHKINAPQTSSMGRLFDAASALIGVRQLATYEGQAAIELEALCSPTEPASYAFNVQDGIFDPAPLWQALLADWRAGVSIPVLAARFHNSVVELNLQLCEIIRQSHGINTVALSGGVWQNRYLLERTLSRLEIAGFNVLWHRQVPTNDGGIALGQAMIAAYSAL
jgi:hydrogenase maturation protein HypF